MRRIMASLAVIGVLAGCTAAEEAPPEEPVAADDPVIDDASQQPLTAEGWGPLLIGMTRDEVTAAVGDKADPEAMGGPEPEFCDEYEPAETPAGLYVMIEQGQLARISLSEGTEVRTPEGLTVGDSAAAVREAYGDAIQAMPHNYIDAPGEYLTIWTTGAVGDNGTSDDNARGIRYVIGEDGMVQTIHAGGPAIQYVEGCL